MELPPRSIQRYGTRRSRRSFGDSRLDRVRSRTLPADWSRESARAMIGKTSARAAATCDQASKAATPLIRESLHQVLLVHDGADGK